MSLLRDSLLAGETLAMAAFSFLESGGSLTLSEWANLDANERGCMTAANRRIVVVGAQRIGACATERGRLEVHADIDGGERLERAMLAESVCREAGHGNE